jgi:tripartite-type tricarboxylate transporter receptor subunit TctC
MIAATAAAAAIVSFAASAQTTAYPTKPVRFIIPFSAGGPAEIPARALATHMSQSMGQQFLIDNRTGASGTIGTDLVVRAPRDGYTLLFTNCSHSSNPSHFKKLPYDSIADLQPITKTNVTAGNLLVVHPSVPARSVKEFIALAQKMPGKLHFASAGVGSPPHVIGALFASMAGISLAHVSYKGTAVAFNDVLGGHVEAMFASAAFVHPHVQAGRVRALGISSRVRSTLFPDVPTFHEAGVTNFDLICYHGIWAPAGTPMDIVRRLHAEAVKALQLPEVRKHFEANGLIPVGNSPEEFAEFLKKDIARMAEVAKKIGLDAL